MCDKRWVDSWLGGQVKWVACCGIKRKQTSEQNQQSKTNNCICMFIYVYM